MLIEEPIKSQRQGQEISSIADLPYAVYWTGEEKTELS